VDAGGNAIGEITFVRTYSRVKDDGTKERWYEVVRRVIEGMYSVQKNHAKENRLPWNDYKAQKSAQEAFDRMFTLKWTPPGRGMWTFGTPLTMEKRNSAALQNCAMVSTKDLDKNDPGQLFAWVMDALMLGIGVGFDTLGKDKALPIHAPIRARRQSTKFQILVKAG
jgi:ribonucleoside-triphosphate reductase (thioredoxin)